MSAIVLVFCLKAALACVGAARQDVRIEDVGPRACAESGYAMFRAAEWAGDHPRWRFFGWHCETVDSDRRSG